MVYDESGNASLLSNSASATTGGGPDLIPPGAVSDLVVSQASRPGGKAPLSSASASSRYAASCAPAYAVDGRTETIWSSTGSAPQAHEYLVVEMDQERNVERVRLFPRSGFTHLFPADFRIETSSDGSNWAVQRTVTGHSATDGQWSEFAFTAAPGRYVRIYVTSTASPHAGTYYVQIAEIEVYEAGAAGATSLELAWTSVGDDDLTGRATEYDIRYSTAAITVDNWDLATPVEGEPAPQQAGRQEEMTLTGLEPDTTYYIAMVVRDEASNESPLSNVGSATTGN